MKKGQLLSQPFVWIFALILGGLILVWGIKTVMDLKEKADLVDLGSFKNEIQSEAKAFYNYGEGSIKTIPASFSGKVKFVCFTDPDNRDKISKITCRYKTTDGKLKACPSIKGMNNNDDAIELLLEDEEKKNMWFLPLGTSVVDSFKINYVKPLEKDESGDIYMVCYQNGKDITMEATGTIVALK